MKKYIKDDNKVRLCSSNISQMDIFESIYYHRYRVYDGIIDHLKSLTDIEYWAIIINSIILLLLPFSYPIQAYLAIRNAKRDMDVYNKEKIIGDWIIW